MWGAEIEIKGPPAQISTTVSMPTQRPLVIPNCHAFSPYTLSTSPSDAGVHGIQEHSTPRGSNSKKSHIKQSSEVAECGAGIKTVAQPTPLSDLRD